MSLRGSISTGAHLARQIPTDYDLPRVSGREPKLDSHGHLNAAQIARRENSDSASTFLLRDRRKLVGYRLRFLSGDEYFRIAGEELLNLALVPARKASW